MSSPTGPPPKKNVLKKAAFSKALLARHSVKTTASQGMTAKSKRERIGSIYSCRTLWGGSDSSTSVPPYCLAAILDMSLSLTSPEESKLLLDLPSATHLDLDSLLVGKVIEEPFPGKPQLTEKEKALQRLWSKIMGQPESMLSRRPPTAATLTGQCTRQQLSKMGNRPVPLHEVDVEEIRRMAGYDHVCQLHQGRPLDLARLKRRHYEKWLHQKRERQKKAFQTLTVEDLVRIHRTYKPGQVDLAMAFDEIGLRGRSRSEIPANLCSKLQIPNEGECVTPVSTKPAGP